MIRNPLNACLLALAVASPVAAEESARATIKKAMETANIPAAGTPNAVWTEIGTLNAMGQQMQYKANWLVQQPDKYRFVMSGEFGGQPLNLTVVFADGKGWEAAGGNVREVAPPKLDNLKQEAYQFRVLGLASLLMDRAFQLKTIDGKNVDNKPTVGVQVDRRDRPSMKLYFDKATNLCVKYESLTKDEFQDYKEVLDEVYLSDYRDVNGRKLFHRFRIVRDGKPLLESKLTNQKFPGSLDPKLFAKPAG